jgi:hypothetical protein
VFVQVSEGCARQLNLRHVLQLVERDGVSHRCLRETELCAFQVAIDPIEQGNDVRRVGCRGPVTMCHGPVAKKAV